MLSREGLQDFIDKNGLAMDLGDITCCQDYFRSEGREPSITEIKMIDTYWSDHCRHTTFASAIDMVEIGDGAFSEAIGEAYSLYLEDRNAIYGGKLRNMTLMDVATIGMKKLRQEGLLEDLDVSDEINACSIVASGRRRV